MNFRRVGIGTVMFAAALVTVAPTVVQAAPITGAVNIGGSTLAITGLAVDFYGNPALGCSQAGVGTPGCFAAAIPLTGSFATLVPLQVAGTIQDLQGPPISGDIALPNFIQFVNGVVFDLTRLEPGGAPDCATVNQNGANVLCTVYLPGNVVTPFVLLNSADGTSATASFTVQVNGYTGSLATGFTHTQVHLVLRRHKTSRASLPVSGAVHRSCDPIPRVLNRPRRPRRCRSPRPCSSSVLGCWARGYGAGDEPRIAPHESTDAERQGAYDRSLKKEARRASARRRLRRRPGLAEEGGNHGDEERQEDLREPHHHERRTRLWRESTKDYRHGAPSIPTARSASYSAR